MMEEELSALNDQDLSGGVKVVNNSIVLAKKEAGNHSAEELSIINLNKLNSQYCAEKSMPKDLGNSSS